MARKAKETTVLTADDMRTIRSAINYAMDERDSYADAFGYKGPEAERAMATMRRFEALHVKLFGEPSAFQQEIEASKKTKKISIFELARQSNKEE